MDDFQKYAFLSVFTASLIGSPHCAGMCGGFVAIYSHHARQNIIPHMLYSLGRLTTYLFLGSLAAIAGITIDSAAPIGKMSALIVGVSLIVSGLLQLFSVGKLFNNPFMSGIVSFAEKIFKKVLKTDTDLKPFLIGLVTTFLPCGWLYTFVALSLSSANLLSALVIMFAFWLGTLPVMLSFGAFSRALTSKLGKFLPRIVAILLILGGFFSINSHINHARQHSCHDSSMKHSGHKK